MSKAVKTVAAKTEHAFRIGGAYWAVVESLRKLGKDKFHTAEKLVAEFPKTMGVEKFKEFKSKDKRNDNGLDCKDRILQNAFVVTRWDYGMPLRALGEEVRREKGEKGLSYGLFSIKPQKPSEIVRQARKVEKPKAVKKSVKKAAKKNVKKSSK